MLVGLLIDYTVEVRKSEELKMTFFFILISKPFVYLKMTEVRNKHLIDISNIDFTVEFTQGNSKALGSQGVNNYYYLPLWQEEVKMVPKILIPYNSLPFSVSEGRGMIGYHFQD